MSLNTFCLFSMLNESGDTTRTFASGYSFLNIASHCPTMLLGTTNIFFSDIPVCLIYIAAAIITYVLPAPTSKASNVLGVEIIFCTASFW